MAFLQQISGLTGKKMMSPLMLKNPYGVLGNRQEPSETIVNDVNSNVNVQPNAVNALPYVDIPSLTGISGEGGGGNMGSPAPGSTTMGQDAVASANPQQGIDAAKGAGKIGLGMAAPDVAVAVGKATKSVPAAIGSYGLMGLFSSGHPALGIANLGFSTAAQAMANADMADAIDNGDIGSDLAGVHNSLTPTNRSPSDDLANIGFETLGDKANKAIQSMHQAKNAPFGFLGSRALNAMKSGNLGESWSEESLMDNMAKEAITPGSTADIGKLGMSQYSQFDPKTNTFSTPEGASAHQSGYGLGKGGSDLGQASPADIASASKAADASMAANDGHMDAGIADAIGPNNDAGWDGGDSGGTSGGPGDGPGTGGPGDSTPGF